MSVILVLDDQGSRNGLGKLLRTFLPDRIIEASKLPHTGIAESFDLILIDAGSLNGDTQKMFAEWREARPATRFAVISGSKSKAEALHFLAVGFHGFLHKLQTNEELLAGIHDLLMGRVYIPSSVVDGDTDEDAALQNKANQETLKLTRRQNEVLALLARGMSNKEIARELNIAEGTSKIHTAALLRAIGARNRTEAAFMGATFLRLRRHPPQDEVSEFRRPWPDRASPRKNSAHLRSYRKSG